MSATSVMSLAPTFVEPVPDEDARPVRRGRRDRWENKERERSVPYRRSRNSEWVEEDEE